MTSTMAPVQAVAFTNASVRLSRMETAQTPTALVVVTPSQTATETQMVVTMNGYTLGAAGTFTVSTTGLPTTYDGLTLNAMPGIATATGVSSQEVTFPITDLTAGTTYAFFITGGLTNPAAGSYTWDVKTQATGPADIENTGVALRVVADATNPDGDQVLINAVVPPTLNCTLSANTTSFTTDLSVGAVTSTTAVNYTVVTNASNGYSVWVQSANAGLTSTAASHTIATAGTVDNGSVSTLSAGTEGYVLDIDINTDSGTAGTGTVTIDGDFNGTGTDDGGALSSTALLEVANADGLTDGDILDLVMKAAIAGTTPAGTDYTDTHTYVCAGNF